MLGIDYAWGKPGGRAIKNAGYDFVCRYLSLNAAKNLTLVEANDLHQNHIAIVLVWETTTQRPLEGYSGGVFDAERAKAMAISLDCPDDKPIYFACDYDFSYQQQAIINNYFNGIQSILPLSRIGIYGGYDVIKRTLDAGLATFAWQTSAWSREKWDPRIHIKQNKYGLMINRVSCDRNEACQSDFGQW